MSDDAVAGAAELVREIERVADRLRVLGPRLGARAASRPPATPAPPAAPTLAEADRLTLQRIRETLRVLADLAADVEGGPRRPVPELAPHGLGDQVLVLGHDLLDGGDPQAMASGLAALMELRRVL